MNVQLHLLIFLTHMGAEDHSGTPKQTPTLPSQDPHPHHHSDNEESNETLPIPHLQELSLQAQPSQRTLPTQPCEQHYSFLKNKAIRKRNRQAVEGKEKLKGKIEKMEGRIKELQAQLEDHLNKEHACPHCHFYTNSQSIPSERPLMTPESFPPPPNYPSLSPSRESLEFEQIDFMTPLMCSPEMEEKSWVFLGTVMIAMGSKVMDMDGTMNVFKVVKESVDGIRRQVEKSEQKLSMDFFMSKQEFMPQSKMDELNFDPFYPKEEEPQRGLQLDGVRVESVEEFQLCFEQKLNFNVKYDALITAMEYLKENSNLSFS